MSSGPPELPSSGVAPGSAGSTYDPSYFAPLSSAEEHHFWFRARKKAFAPLVRQLTESFSRRVRVLEVGCGNGGSLELLRKACSAGFVVGFDLHFEGLRFARRRGGGPLVQGDLRAIPFRVPFELICLFDVLEHLDDDSGVLRDMRALLVPGGALFLTVPAGPSLWSYFDVVSHHKRRYRADDLRRKLVDTGFRVEYLTPYMASLLPIVWIGRRLAPLIGRIGSRRASALELATDEIHVSPLLNGLLSLTLKPESHLIAKRRRLPFGTSYLAIARNVAAPRPETNVSTPDTGAGSSPRRPGDPSRNDPCRPCPVCGSSDASFLVEVEPLRLSRNSPPLQGRYRHFKCRDCDATFLSEMPPAEHLALYYDSPEYHLALSGDEAPSPEASFSIFRRLQYRVSRPLPRGPAGRHLDFGCGPGHYLDHSRRCGWSGTGIEYSEESARAARARGHDVRLVGDLGSLPEESFDFISSVHSLEHVERPTETLTLLGRKLKPGGVLFLEVPYLGQEFRLFRKHYSMMQAPLHAVFFDDSTIRYMGDRAGLRLLRAKNALFSPVFYVWSLLNATGALTGVEITMQRKFWLGALASPVTIVPAAIASLLGLKGAIRQFTLTKERPRLR